MATINNREDDDNVETRSRIIDDLNDTLLELIFTKLYPWRYLAVSKCVSKRWESIISNPDFTRQLTSQSLPFTLVVAHVAAHGHNRQCIITENSHFPKHKFPLEFIPTPHNFVATTNELVVAYHNINSQIGEYYVANPLTKQYVVVPTLGKRVSTDGDYMLGIAGFVNGVSSVNFSHRDNYYYNNNHGFRIVQVTAENYKSNPTVQIYSSETGQWKTYLYDHWECPLSICRSAITWNNKIHWTNNWSKFVVIDPFDLDNIAPRVLGLPITIGYNSVLGVCQNRLRITQFEETCSNRQNQRIKIWEIEDYDNRDEYYSGTDCFLVEVKLVIDFVLKRSLLNNIFPASDRYDPRNYHRIICCHPNDPQVVYFYYGGRIFYCNVVEHKYKKVGYCQNASETFVFVHPP